MIYGRIPYVTPFHPVVEVEENRILSYLSLSAGPIGQDVTFMAGRLGSIGYFHRVNTGIKPVAAMPRVKLKIRALGRAWGPARRKLPISVEDMGALKGMIELMRIDPQILWATVLLGRVFALRLTELIDSKNPHTPEGRSPYWYLKSATFVEES